MLEAHRDGASTSVCLHVERRLHELVAADSELRAALAKAAPEVQTLVDAVELHGTSASASVRALAAPRLLVLEAANAALRLALAKMPKEAAELQAAVVEYGPTASASVATQAERQLSELRDADAALKAAMAKRPAEAHEAKAAIDVHGSAASASAVEAAQTMINGLQRHDDALRQLLASTPLEAADVKANLDDHGPHASASTAAAVSRRLDELMAADEALRAAMADSGARLKKSLAEIEAAAYLAATVDGPATSSPKRPEAAGAAKAATSADAKAAAALAVSDVATQHEAERRKAVLISHADMSAAIERHGVQASGSMAARAADAALASLLEAPSLEARELRAGLAKYGARASDGVKHLLEGRLSRGTCRLKIVLVRAEQLKAADSNGSSDAYAVLTAGSKQKHKSAVAKKTLSPVWNETFVFEGARGELLATGVVLSVFDWNRFSAHAPLGEVRLSLPEMEAAGAMGSPYAAALSTQGVVHVVVEWEDEPHA